MPNRQTSALKIIPRAQHTLSRTAIDPNALKVLYRLHKAGYQAYLVGGGVRDLLLGKQPKDFDITTNATPDQVRVLFRNCRLVGRRFRLAHILFGRQVVEVATFRGHHNQQTSSKLDQTAQGRLLRDNVYGTIEEDAQRRDFTINSLYYNIADFSLRDYASGLVDLQQKVIRLIGDAESRYREDPVRMLRAIRFAAKLDMPMSEATAAPITHLAPLLHEIPAARLFEESLKLLQTGQGLRTYALLRDYHLFRYLFPLMTQDFPPHRQVLLEKMIQQALQNCDQRIVTGKTVNPAFLLAAMLWYPLLTRAEDAPSGAPITYAAFMLAIGQVLQEQCRTLAIPRRLTNTMRDIWQLQLRLPRYHGSRAQRLLAHPKFRAAYDLLRLRAEIEGGELAKLEAWWCRFQQQNPIVEKERLHHSRGRNSREKKLNPDNCENFDAQFKEKSRDPLLHCHR